MYMDYCFSLVLNHYIGLFYYSFIYYLFTYSLIYCLFVYLCSNDDEENDNETDFEELLTFVELFCEEKKKS